MFKTSLSVAALTAMLAAPAFAQTDAPVVTDSEAAADVREMGHDAADAAADATNEVGAAVSAGVENAREAATDARDSAAEALENLDTLDAKVDADITANTADADDMTAQTTAGAYLSSDIIGADIYHPTADVATVPAATVETPTADAAVTPAETTAVVGTDGMEKVAEVSDILISKDGQVMGYIADVGGFLGIGQRSVVLGLDTLTPTAVNGDEHALTIAMTKEELEALPEFVEP